jgi:hypothetical protein
MVHQLLASEETRAWCIKNSLRPSDASALHLALSTLAVVGCFFIFIAQCLEAREDEGEHKRGRDIAREREGEKQIITCAVTVVTRLQKSSVKSSVKRNTLETYLHPEILALGADDSAFASLGHNTARARLSWWLAAARCQFALRQVAHRRVLFGKRQRSHGFAVAHIVEVVKCIGWRLLA